MIYRYDEVNNEFIGKFEEEQIMKIQERLGFWRGKFAERGCVIEINVFWRDMGKGQTSRRRLPFGLNYSSNLSCDVVRNNCIINDVEDEDSALSVCWPIVQIYKKRVGGAMIYLMDQESYIEIDRDINDFWNTVERLNDRKLL